VRRLRPDGSNRQSFPSGHAAITVAPATVIERQLGWRKAVLCNLLGRTPTNIGSYRETARYLTNRTISGRRWAAYPSYSEK
jgi:membrane-associated phospholipid phosphatase